MYEGGMFKGGEWEDEGGKKYRMCICWGSLTNDPDVKMYNKRKVSFNLKWYRKQYINVVMWGDSDAADLATTLEKGDMVLCMGTITSTKYIPKKGEHAGEERDWYDLNCQIIIPMSLIMFIIQLYGSQGIQKLLNESYSSSSDVMESADDYSEDEYENFEIPEDLDVPF